MVILPTVNLPTGKKGPKEKNLQIFLGYPVVNDPLYNHTVFGPEKGRGGHIGKTDEQLIQVRTSRNKL